MAGSAPNVDQALARPEFEVLIDGLDARRKESAAELKQMVDRWRVENVLHDSRFAGTCLDLC
jgi:hypothetical protein